MREIKFRAWDREKKEMIRFDGISFCSEYDFLSFSADKVDCLYGREIESCEFMQFTGLKDRNGKEIFEGDVVKGSIPDSEHDEPFNKAQIKYIGSSFCLTRMKQREFDVNDGLYLGDLESCVLNKSIEVIGNIYESPELLK